MTNIKLKQLVVFAILMENNNGILEKSPSYILEKYDTTYGNLMPEQLLDQKNLAKYKTYLKRWGI